VLYSLFEEPTAVHPVSPKDYFAKVTAAKRKLSIPVIASLTRDAAGLVRPCPGPRTGRADALELNIYETRVSTTGFLCGHRVDLHRTVQKVVACGRHSVAVSCRVLHESGLHHEGIGRSGREGIRLVQPFYLPDTDLKSLKQNQFASSSVHPQRTTIAALDFAALTDDPGRSRGQHGSAPERTC